MPKWDATARGVALESKSGYEDYHFKIHKQLCSSNAMCQAKNETPTLYYNLTDISFNVNFEFQYRKAIYYSAH